MHGTGEEQDTCEHCEEPIYYRPNVACWYHSITANSACERRSYPEPITEATPQELWQKRLV